MVITLRSVLRSILLALLIAALPAASFGAVFVSVAIAPPLLPVYTQPICPGEGYVWAPGYWAYGPDGYFWVPGTWVLAPFTGALWTPGYWGWGDGFYRWHEGFWGPQVGFYGGINYGFGYAGFGYDGGYWNSGAFYYNTTVNNVNTTIIHNVYSRTVGNTTTSRVSYNGGNGGTTVRPTAAQLAAARGPQHAPPTAAQTQLQRVSSMNRAQLSSVNHGRPAVLAESKPVRRATANRAGQSHVATNGSVRPRENPAAGVRHEVRSARATPPSKPRAASPTRKASSPTRHPAARNPAPTRTVHQYRAPAAHSSPAGRTEARQHTSPPQHDRARNNPAPQPAAHHRAPVQHTAPRANTKSNRTIPARSARSNPVPQSAASPRAQPIERAPRPQSAQHPPRNGNGQRREGG
jgi:hypothetical protein